MAHTEWSIHLKCKRCGRNSYGYTKASRLDKKTIGCKNCGLNTSVNIKECSLKVGQLEIGIYIPYYC